MSIISDNTIGTYTGDYSGVSDCYMREDNATTNYSSSTLSIQKETGAQRNCVQIFTGLSNIDSGDTVSDATIGWNMYNSAGIGSLTIVVYRLIVAFTANQATWNDRQTSTAWNTGGALGSGSDYNATLLASTIVNNTTGWFTWNDANLTDYVQKVVNGTYTDYGLLFFTSSAADSGEWKAFYNSNDTDGNRPYMDVTHSAATGSNLLTLLGVG